MSEIHCSLCWSTNIVPYPKLGPDWYKCLDCLSKFNDPIIIPDKVENATE
jgi:hypothetical protein